MTAARHLRAVGAARYGIVVRVSQVMGRSGERFHSPATQEAAARRAVAAAGGVIDEQVGDRGVFTDLDVSGKTAPSDRPGMGAALELVRQGRLDGVAVYDVSRWSRDTVSGLRELQEIAALGGNVLSAGENVDVGTPTGMFSTTIFLAAAQLKRDEASKAWKATHQSRHDQGLPHGKVPLGYVAAGGEVTVDPVLGPVIAQAFLDYAAGTSQKALAERLTQARGMLTRQGVVSRLLRNPFHTGLLTYAGSVKVGRHDPLVTVEVFDRVQARLADDRFASPRLRAPVSWTSGLLRCFCGRRLHRRGTGNSSGGARYKCPDPGCDGIGTPLVADVEAGVLVEVLLRARQVRDGTPEALAKRSRAARAGADADALRVEARNLEAALGRAGALLTAGTFDDVAYAATTRELRAQLAAVTARLEQAERQAGAGVTLAAMTTAAERLEATWPDLTTIERREFAALFVGQVTIEARAYRGQPVAERLTPEEA